MQRLVKEQIPLTVCPLSNLKLCVIKDLADHNLPRLLAAGLKVIEQLPEATLLRIDLGQGQREIYSLLRNRAHSNVAFMAGESLRYQPGLDTLTVYPGVLVDSDWKITTKNLVYTVRNIDRKTDRIIITGEADGRHDRAGD